MSCEAVSNSPFWLIALFLFTVRTDNDISSRSVALFAIVVVAAASPITNGSSSVAIESAPLMFRIVPSFMFASPP